MQKIVQKIKENKKMVIAAAILFLAAFFYNLLSPYTTDDYSYMFSFADGARITNPLRIFESLQSHYMHIHGRILPHFFVQLILMFPKWIFDILNAGAYLLLVILVLQVPCKKKFSTLLFFAVPVAFWVYIPDYGQIFLWLTGSINYCWAFILSLLYMKVYVNLFQNPQKKLAGKGILALSVFSLFFGAYSELVSFPVIFICFLIVCMVMWEKHTIRAYWSYVIPIAAGAAGYLTMLLSPAETTRQGTFALSLIFKRFIDIFETYYQCAGTLLILWAVFMVLANYFKADKKQIIVSVCLFAVNLISMAMLSVASYVVPRHFAIPIFYLLASIITLMQSLRGRGQIECVSYCVCAYIITISIWSIWEGTYDIYDVNRRQQEREAYIYEQIESGNNEVLTVPIIRPLTKYSCKYDLMDIRTDDADPWPNAEIAKYYGLKKIYGQEAD